jgi:hypothetical protein
VDCDVHISCSTPFASPAGKALNEVEASPERWTL